MFLADTNIFLEVLLAGNKAEKGFQPGSRGVGGRSNSVRFSTTPALFCGYV
jgi:hypothetical protein